MYLVTDCLNRILPTVYSFSFKLPWKKQPFSVFEVKYVDTINILDSRTHLRQKAKETILHGGREWAISTARSHPGAQWCSQPEEGKGQGLPGLKCPPTTLDRWYGSFCWPEWTPACHVGTGAGAPLQEAGATMTQPNHELPDLLHPSLKLLTPACTSHGVLSTFLPTCSGKGLDNRPTRASHQQHTS